jgi:hypothetical protein
VIQIIKILEMGLLSNDWSVGVYTDNFNRIMFACHQLYLVITNKIDLMSDIGFHVVNTFKTSDFGRLNEEIEDYIRTRNQFKPVGIKEQSKPDGARSTLYNLTNLFDKKILCLGLLERRLIKEKGVYDVSFKDIAHILPKILQDIYKIDPTSFGSPKDYFPLPKLVRVFASTCEECKQTPGYDNKGKCTHVYEEWDEHGFVRYINTDDDLDTYLTENGENDPKTSDIFAIVIGRLSSVIKYADYKICIQAEKVYIPNLTLRNKIDQLRGQRVNVTDEMLGKGMVSILKEPNGSECDSK